MILGKAIVSHGDLMFCTLVIFDGKNTQINKQVKKKIRAHTDRPKYQQHPEVWRILAARSHLEDQSGCWLMAQGSARVSHVKGCLLEAWLQHTLHFPWQYSTNFLLVTLQIRAFLNLFSFVIMHNLIFYPSLSEKAISWW